MKIVQMDPKRIDSGVLVKDLLGLEPEDLASTLPGREGGSADALQTLGAFMRRVVERAIVAGGVKDLAFHLEANGVSPSYRSRAKAANLATLLTWSLVQPKRRVKGLAFAALKAPRAGTGDQPVVAAHLRAMPIEDLLAEFERPIEGDYDPSGRDGARSFPISAAKALHTTLGLDGKTLCHYRSDLTRAEGADEQTRLGLERLVVDVLSQFKMMRERRTSAVRLMSVDDAKDANIADVRAAHIATLLAAALHAEGGNDVLFLSPSTRSARDKARLREMAKLVYLDYSDEAKQGFELICDGFVHFGHGLEWTIAEKLLYEVAGECDPDLQRMPYCVSVQASIDHLLKAC